MHKVHFNVLIFNLTISFNNHFTQNLLSKSFRASSPLTFRNFVRNPLFSCFVAAIRMEGKTLFNCQFNGIFLKQCIEYNTVHNCAYRAIICVHSMVNKLFRFQMLHGSSNTLFYFLHNTMLNKELQSSLALPLSL